MTRGFIATLGVIVLAASTVPGGQTAPAERADPAREFPSFESSLASLVREAATARQAEAARLNAPAAAATIRLLFEANRIDDAFQGLDLATQGPTDELIAAMDVLNEFNSRAMDDPRGSTDRISAILTPVRARVSTLPREDAARLAARLLDIDRWLDARKDVRPAGGNDWRDRAMAFVQEYRGTQEALKTEVRLIDSDTHSASQAGNFDAVIAKYPGSDAAALALYLKGFRLGADRLEPDGGDPINRFLQIVAIVDELESGRYPAGEGVRMAPQLLFNFYPGSVPPSAYAPGSVDRMLAEYQRFVRNHFTGDLTFGYGVGYTIASRIESLYGVRGDRVAGVERTLTELERAGADKRAIDLFRAEYWARQATYGAAAERSAMQAKAEAALTTMAYSGTDYFSRRAAALLASLFMYQRDFGRARPAYDAYASRFPSSAFAWVARMRAGQCLVEQDDLAGAAAMFEETAGDPQEPLALVIGSALAAQSYDALGQFDHSLLAYRRALAAWPVEYWRDLTPQPNLMSQPAPATVSVVRRRVTRQILVDRVSSLERNLKTTVGPLLERAAWQIDERQFEEARATLAAASTRAAAGEQTAVRILDHQLQLEIAIRLLSAGDASADVARTLKALDAIAAVPFDSSAGFAGLAKAAVLLKLGADDQARVQMSATLEAWRDSQRLRRDAKPTSPLTADVAEIRAVLLNPAGTVEVQSVNTWETMFRMKPTTDYVVVNPDVWIIAADGTANRVEIYQSVPDLPKVIFWTTDEIALTQRLLSALRGPRTTGPTNQTPAAENVRTFWNSFFAAHQGDLDRWVVEAYPTLGSITFLDEARTKAVVAVRAGYTSTTVVMEKRNGVWKAIRLGNIGSS